MTDGNFTYNVTAPSDIADLANITNTYTGMVNIGMLFIVWFVVFGSIHRRGYPAVDAMIAANFTSTAFAMLMFPFGLVSGQIIVFMFTISAGIVTIKYMADQA